jgi:hypothetical protein
VILNTYQYLNDKIDYYYKVKDTEEGDGLYDNTMDDIEDAHEDGDITEVQYYKLLEML